MLPEVVELDVRPMLEAGQEPFQYIMEVVDRLAPGQSLRLLAPFKPHPLLRVMERKGFSHVLRAIGEDHWEVIFSIQPPPLVEVSSNAVEIQAWPDPCYSEDLRGLRSAAAMERLEKMIRDRADGEVVFVLLAPDHRQSLGALETHGHAWFGSIDPDTGVYRAMIRVCHSAVKVNCSPGQ